MLIKSGNQNSLVDFHIGSSVMTEFATLPALNMTNLTCRDDFFEQNFTCLPRCDSWDPRPHNSLTIIDDTIRTLCITLRFLLGGLFLIIFALRRKVL